MEHSGRVRKKVVNNFYGKIDHFYHFDAPVTYNGPVYYKGGSGSSANQLHYSDQQIAHALEAVCGEGKAVDEKRKWAAVYWCMRWYCNFPVRGTEFCERIGKLPFSKKLNPECDYDNIRRLITASFMKQDARRMDSVRPEKKDEDFYSECRIVVMALAQELGKEVLPKP